MITAIIQARMGSTRLPGKTLKEILGRPMLWHLINRLKYSKYIDNIIIATTTKDRDDVIVEFAKNHKLQYFRGDEDDVLDRFYQTAKKFDVDVIVRVTPDCPLLDPEVVDMVIKKYLDNKDVADYVSNTHPTATFPDGIDVEVFTFKALEKAWIEAKKISEREHVTPYIWNNPGKFSLHYIQNHRDLSNLRLSVDQEEDFVLITKIFEALYRKDRLFTLRDILNFLDNNNHLLGLNNHIKINEGYEISLKKDRCEE